MRIEAGSGIIRVWAPAKLNLFLEILGKRDDGFHELETIMCPITLFDQLAVQTTSAPEIKLTTECPEQSAEKTECSTVVADEDPAWQLPASEDNLVVRAAQAVQNALGTHQGCQIHLQKRIPAAAGLGGGSSDAAAAVVACLWLWGVWDRSLATEICQSLGSDIPFFLGDEQRIGMAIATGRGERIHMFSETPALDFVVSHPPRGCSTREIYAGFQRSGFPHPSEEIIQACKTGQSQKIGAKLFNALQSPACHLNEWIGIQLHLMTSHGLEHALMSGSGSACFALHHETAPTEATIRSLKQAGIRRVYKTSTWDSLSIERQLATATKP